MSTSLERPKSNYPNIDKQAYELYKVVKYITPYILKAHTFIIVPHWVVWKLFVQQDLGENRVDWITCLQEYHMQFKLIHTIEGHDLRKLATKVRYTPK